MKHLNTGDRIRVAGTGLLAGKTGTVIVPSLESYPHNVPARVRMDEPIPLKMRYLRWPDTDTKLFADECDPVEGEASADDADGRR